MKTQTQTASKPKFRMRSSIKIAIGFLVVTIGGWFAYNAITDQIVGRMKFDTLAPGDRFNLVGIAGGRGYHIRVANRMAQLVEGENIEFDAQGGGDEDREQGDMRRRIPVRELLQSLQGDEKALGHLVMVVNDKAENDDWPTLRVVWKKEDLEKALSGDKALEAKLVRDLNMNLDGTPLETLRPASFNGIILDMPVPVRVQVGAETKTVTARIQEPYLPQLMDRVQKLYEQAVSEASQVGYYTQEVKSLRAGLADGTARPEDIRRSLRARYDERRLADFARSPERLLSSARVVINDSFVTGASYRSYTGPDGNKLHDMTIQLSPEGRNRLWQYSRGRVGSQLLMIVTGWPIAAPRVRHDLSDSTLTITQLPDENLVRRAVDAINQRKATTQR